jgi:hypothetical protein
MGPCPHQPHARQVPGEASAQAQGTPLVLAALSVYAAAAAAGCSSTHGARPPAGELGHNDGLPRPAIAGRRDTASRR